MGTGRRLEEAPRGEHCAPAGRRSKTPSGEKLGGRGWTAGWDPAGRFKEARKAGDVNTLQEDESEEEEWLFGLREMGGGESAEEDNTFLSSADKDSEESTDEGGPPSARGIPPLPLGLAPPPPRGATLPPG